MPALTLALLLVPARAVAGAPTEAIDGPIVLETGVGEVVVAETTALEADGDLVAARDGHLVTLTPAVALRVTPGVDVAALVGGDGTVAPVAAVDGAAVVVVDTAWAAIDLAARLRGMDGVLYAYVLDRRQLSTRAIPNDPLFPQQWHLPAINAPTAWDVARGAGVTIGIVDEGVEFTHPDLAAAYEAPLSYDFGGLDADPSPGSSPPEDHGTAVAGVAAARGDNGIGVAGVASLAGFAALRLSEYTDVEEAGALGHREDAIEIKNSSWGPEDDAERLEGPGPLVADAISQDIATGRGGRGTIYVWAGGNGREGGDNSNYDGYANSPYAIAVGAVNEFGAQANYSEPGANLLVVAPSSSGDMSPPPDGIVTTDRTGTGPEEGYSPADYTPATGAAAFGGTSSAAPAVAGVVALMLEANPNLSWRDVQDILARSATRNDAGDPGWHINGAGLPVSHKYGFGLVDAAAAVSAAQTHTALGPLQVIDVPVPVNAALPDDGPAVVRSVTFSGVLTVEHVQVVIDATHSYRGDIEVTLTSPSGTVSRLSESHNDPNDHIDGWAYSTVHSWGEAASGTWTIAVRDAVPDDAGAWTGARLILWGSGPGTEPVAVLSTNRTTGIAPAVIRLDASGSTDLDGDPLAFVYSLPGVTVGAVHTASVAGAFTGLVSVSVTDPLGHAAGAAVPLVVIEAPPHGFSDVGAASFADAAIASLRAKGITAGAAPGLYAPSQVVTREQMAVFLVRTYEDAAGQAIAAAPAAGFTDTAGSFAAAAIDQATALGLSAGCGGGRFCPTDIVTREQMAVFLMALYEAILGAPYAGPVGLFMDTGGSFAATRIGQASGLGITAGCGGTSYCPAGAVTREQMAQFIYRLLGAFR